ncbi:MAG TPA: redox-regulated ATPase YchF [archaeon]|nr:redox-regulated ATPase YchF [archaeon]HLD80864.1 redox-regulated ATPase YchF [archaeon]
MELGVVGKPNCGKSTFFSACTLVDVEIANYPFTTIEANRGVTYVRVPDPGKDFGVTPNPRNSKVANGVRFVPVTILDVAGLVPGAHEGKGLGNKFLDDLSNANALVHVVDMSGGTDSEGRVVALGTHDPASDVRFLELELDHWIAGVLRKHWHRIESKHRMQGEKLTPLVCDALSGLHVTENQVENALRVIPSVNAANLAEFASELRKASKPLVIAANKMDLQGAGENLERCRKAFPGYSFIPTAGEAELALRKAERAGIIRYSPGGKDFELLRSDLPERQLKALEFVREKVLKKYGSTGVQQVIDAAVFQLLKRIVVFPVEDEHKLSDSKGLVLPDALLLPENSTPLDLAFAIHSDIGKNFAAAYDCRKKMKVSKDAILKTGDVVKIFAKN